jgi:hypothetical protein
MVKTISIRFPDEVHAQLKDEYARTYALHRLSFNGWLLARITQGSVIVRSERGEE